MRALLALCALATLAALSGCETRTRGILVPAVPDTVAVRDTVVVDSTQCWPPGHCKEMRDMLIQREAIRWRVRQRIDADRRGRTQRISALPHGYSGTAFLIRYKGVFGDTTIAQLDVDPNVTFEPGVDGEVIGDYCNLVASIYYEVSGDSVANMHAYGYAGVVRLQSPGGKDDWLLIGEDICAGARMRWDLADSPGTYGEAIEVTLLSTGESFTVPRNADVEGKVGRWAYRASSRDVVGGARGVGLFMRWGRVEVEIGSASLGRSSAP